MNPVVADADVLFGATTRALLIFLDYHGALKLHWSPLILDEVARALVQTGRKATLADAQANRARMEAALPQAMVSTRAVQAHFKPVAAAVRSAKDIHVAACAHYLLHAKAYPGAMAVSLVSRNVGDYRVKDLAALGIGVKRADPYLLALLQQSPVPFAAAFRAFRLSLRTAPAVVPLLDKLAGDGQTQTAAELLLKHVNGALDL
nr:PIN domain-containing protein [uncultured Albidiferax sp.]